MNDSVTISSCPSRLLPGPKTRQQQPPPIRPAAPAAARARQPEHPPRDIQAVSAAIARSRRTVTRQDVPDSMISVPPASPPARIDHFGKPACRYGWRLSPALPPIPVIAIGLLAGCLPVNDRALPLASGAADLPAIELLVAEPDPSAAADDTAASPIAAGNVPTRDAALVLDRRLPAAPNAGFRPTAVPGTMSGAVVARVADTVPAVAGDVVAGPVPGSVLAATAGVAGPRRAERWTVRSGETLMQTLRRWGDRAGIAVFWDACPSGDKEDCIDWRNQQGGVHEGDFDAALGWLLRGHGEAEPRPVAVKASNRAVRILADGGYGRSE